MIYQQYLNSLNNKKVLILGLNGYLSSRVQEWNLKRETPITLHSFRDEEGFWQYPRILSSFEYVINTIANTDTKSTCADVVCQQSALNISYPIIFSEYCNDHNIKFCHISSGCVYSDGGPHDENGPISCETPYYMTKYLADCQLSKMDLILRPRLLFDNRKNPKNLLDKVAGYDTVVGREQSATSTDLVIAAALYLLENNHSGIFNVAEKEYLNFSQLYPDKKVSNKYYKTVKLDCGKLDSTGFIREDNVISKCQKSIQLEL